MTKLVKFFWWCVFATCIAVAFSPAHSAEQSECFSLQELKRSFHVVVPNAQQVTMDGATAQAYLDEYNSLGPATGHKAESLLFIIAPRSVMVLFLTAGKSCDRRLIHPFIHQNIMTKISKGKA